MTTQEKLDICIEALEQLREPSGAFHVNKFTHAENTIRETIRIATETLKKVKDEEVCN